MARTRKRLAANDLRDSVRRNPNLTNILNFGSGLFVLILKYNIRINEKSEENIFGGVFVDVDRNEVLHLKDSFGVDPKGHVGGGAAGAQHGLEEIGLVPLLDQLRATEGRLFIY